MKKWIKFFILLIILVYIILVCKKIIKNNYKKEETGNNKNIEEIEQYILNIESYKANIHITVTSNKNVNFYDFTQEVKVPEMERQIATSPEELAGVEILYENGALQIKNSKYNLSKIYDNYPYVSNNQLFLTSFLEGYRNAGEKEIEEKENHIIMSYKSGQNKYNSLQTLYINKGSLRPESLQIMDINKDCKVNIEYKEIEFNI